MASFTSCKLAILTSYEDNCIQKRKTTTNKAIWWNKNLGTYRKTVCKLFNKAEKNGEWTTYYRKLTKYNNQIGKTKEKSWRSCAQRWKTSRVWQNSKTVEFLLPIHFPGSTIDDQETNPIVNIYELSKNSHNHDWATRRPDKSTWALSTF